jgi:hypothetical protein
MASEASTSERDVNPRSGAEAVRELAVHAARIQLASLTAAGRFLAGWAQSADRYAQTLSDELLGRVEGATPPGELVPRLADATNAHLRELSTLPSVAVDHFNQRVSREEKPSPRGRRRRGAA